MASSTTFSIITTALVLLLSLIIPTSSTSRGVLNHPKPKNIGFKVKLRHVDSSKNLTKLERIQRQIKRGNLRLDRFKVMSLADQAPNLEAPASSYPNSFGEYLMELAIGTPPTPFEALIDTGSDLIWTQCKPCIECYIQSTPIFDSQKSPTFSTIPCFSPICDQVSHPTWYDNSLETHVCDACPFRYSYGDGSLVTYGVLATETLTFGGDSYSGICGVSIPNVVIGCSERNEAGVSGIMGLNRGPLSLVAQLQEPKFSLCQTPLDDPTKKSTLLVGSSATVDGLENVITTPLIKAHAEFYNRFYYLTLEGISVGGIRLAIDRHSFEVKENGLGGIFIDSGSTYSCFEKNIFEIIAREFIAQMSIPLDTSESLAHLDLCFRVPPYMTEVVIPVPSLVYHFEGGDLNIPPLNYLVKDAQPGQLCLAIIACRKGTPANLFGNFHTQNMLVTYDVAAETISFAPAECDQL